ncbi:SAF domain-containing protein [Nocardia albiluteola]|nr:SAF domain-containing protein [Nocardia albiluteola]
MTKRMPSIHRLGADRGGDRDLGRAPRWEALLDRRPAWADAVLARRILAAALTALAGYLLLRGDPASHRIPAVVAAHDLAPGQTIVAADLRRAEFAAGALPAGALHELAPLEGATLTTAMRAGEIFTDVRIVGPRLAAAATGVAGARIVPIRLADNAVADILRSGDRVDVVAADPESAVSSPQPLAVGAVVVSVPGGEKSGRERASPDRSGAASERIVLIALDSAHATTVAAASLRTALTVVFQ